MTNYQHYLNWGLTTFEDFLEAFTKYQNGGWWIRKIDYKDAFYREITEGPYNKKEADLKAENWNKYFKYKKLKTANVYSLIDLLCNHNMYMSKLEKYLYREYIWQPPNGAELFCLIKGDRKVFLDSKENIDSNFRKFINYSLDNNIKSIEVKDYLIFYKDSDFISKLMTKKLKRLVNEYSQDKETLRWLYLEAININSYREGKKPLVIPDYIVNFKKDIKPLTLDFFKVLKSKETLEAKIETLFDEIKKNKSVLLVKNNNYKIGYLVPIIYDEKDTLVKCLEFSYKDKVLEINYKEEEYSILLNVNVNKNLNSLKLNFPFLDNVDFFDNKIIDLFFYICKVLNLDSLKLKDDYKEYCKCNKLSNISVYINIIRFLANKESIYSMLGFKEANIELREEIVKPYREKIITVTDNFVYTYENLANEYLEGFCKYNYVCNLLEEITSEIYQEMENKNIYYILDLDIYNLSSLADKLIS